VPRGVGKSGKGPAECNQTAQAGSLLKGSLVRVVPAGTDPAPWGDERARRSYVEKHERL
jgi:hypothetical protein